MLKKAYTARKTAFDTIGNSLPNEAMRAKYQATETAINLYEAAGGRLVTSMNEGDMAAAKKHVQQMTVMGGDLHQA